MAQPDTDIVQVEKKVVVLGDSIGAGPAASMKPVRFTPYGHLVGDFNDDPAQIRLGPWPDCPQVGKAWPFRLDTSPQFSVVNNACSGATIDDVMNGTKAGRSSQLNQAVIDADIVLIVVGANDVGFVDALICMVTRFDCTKADLASLFNKLSALQTDLVRLLNKVVQMNPRALVKMVGYPILFSETSELNQVLCPGVMPVERDLSLEAQQKMVSSTEAAVQEMQAIGGNVGFINPQTVANRSILTDAGPMTAVSDACTDTPARIITSITNSVDPIQQVVHPNEGGHRWYADLIQEDLELVG